jgi:hypothetical protein
LQLLARFLAAVISGGLSFHLINKKADDAPVNYATVSNEAFKRTDGVSWSEGEVGNRKSKISPGMPPLRSDGFMIPPSVNAMGIPLAGKSMDLTIFASIRALDTLMQFLPPPPNPKLRRIFHFAAKTYIPFFFITSTTTIMHAFFYAPVRLPHSYVSWIRRVAQLDERLLQALREARYGNFIYGKNTGIAPLLGSMCRDLGLPEEWGDPAKTIPVPCDLVHQGSGHSCEKHALLRLLRSMKIAMGVYAPLQAIMLLRRFRTKSMSRQKAVMAALFDALRSSTFLGAFIALFYYGVCLSRTRLGPKLFSNKTVTPQMWDGGLCILGGCAACGWSIFFEVPRRRIELMLFVLPRAVAVWLPRRYERPQRWKEHIVFTLSAAVVLTAAQHWPERVRGVFGRVLRGLLTSSSLMNSYRSQAGFLWFTSGSRHRLFTDIMSNRTEYRTPICRGGDFHLTSALSNQSTKGDNATCSSGPSIQCCSSSALCYHKGVCYVT